MYEENPTSHPDSRQEGAGTAGSWTIGVDPGASRGDRQVTTWIFLDDPKDQDPKPLGREPTERS